MQLMIISYKKNATSSDALMHIANPTDSDCNNFQATTIANADDLLHSRGFHSGLKQPLSRRYRQLHFSHVNHLSR